MKYLKRMSDPFINIYPTLDLHGSDRVYAVYKTKEFIEDNIKLNNKKIVIIHGIGLGIIKKEIHKYLSSEKKVKTYKLYNNNIGVTIVELK